MGAELKFYAGSDFQIQELSGSGLGFYGANFGSSIRTGFHPDRTFITNAGGTSLGPEADNCKWEDDDLVILGSAGSGISLLAVPNYQATLNIRFTNDTAVRVENVKAYFYDRSSGDKNLPASGVTVKAAEVIHVPDSQLEVGSGDSSWLTVGGSGSVLELANSPGPSGFYAGNGSNSLWSDTRHDWFCMISPSPDTIGSKPFGLLVELEYL